MFLEKAYAKKYGSYAKIEGGQVDQTLAELTNGIPDRLDKGDYGTPLAMWNKAKSALDKGANLGAGTPSHPQGDRAKSKTGIVQGHAYSLM